MNNLTISSANLEDSSEIAKLMIVAAGGLMEFLLHDLVDDISIEQLVTFEVEDRQSEISYRKTEVAKLNGQVLGIANFYPADEHRITQEMKDFFPKERLEVLEEFYNSCVDNSLFLNALAVKVEYCGQSIGTQLIDRVKKKARSENFSSVSLIVWADNYPAIRFYKYLGFEEVKPIFIDVHPLLPHQGGAKLMNYVLK